MRRQLLAVVTAALFIPGVGAAQAGSCDIEPASPNTIGRRIGADVYVSGRATYRCTGGTVVVSDSAVNAYGRLLLIGRVSYDDPEKTVTGADRIEYEGRQGVVSAIGDVTVHDKKTGSVLHAPLGLTYMKQTRTNPEARMQVFSGRPRATMLNVDSTGGRDTTIVDADRMDMIGERLFRGWGQVVIDRGDVKGNGAFLEYVQGNRLILSGRAQVRTNDTQLFGDSIHADLVGDAFKEVRAFRSARVEAKDLTVVSDRLRIMFDSSLVQRLIAVSDTTGGQQALATTAKMELRADSIEAITPKQIMDRVVAVGRAFGRRMPDSVDTKLPEMIRYDWVRGDTVTSHFTAESDSALAARRAREQAAIQPGQPRPAPDTTRNQVPDTLIASGQPASSLYRHREEGDTTSVPGANYLTARRITVVLKDGEVKDVEAEGDLKGIYLQPVTGATIVRPGEPQPNAPPRPRGSGAAPPTTAIRPPRTDPR